MLGFWNEKSGICDVTVIDPCIEVSHSSSLLGVHRGFVRIDRCLAVELFVQNVSMMTLPVNEIDLKLQDDR